MTPRLSAIVLFTSNRARATGASASRWRGQPTRSKGAGAGSKGRRGLVAQVRKQRAGLEPLLETERRKANHVAEPVQRQRGRGILARRAQGKSPGSRGRGTADVRSRPL